MQEKVKANPKVKILWNSEVVEAVGNAKLEKLVINNNKTGKTSDFPVDGLFVAIGHKPQSDVFAGIVARDEKGFIKPVDWHCGTSVPGIFVAGDVMDKDFKQAITSAGMGCIAAMETLKFLEETNNSVNQ